MVEPRREKKTADRTGPLNTLKKKKKQKRQKFPFCFTTRSFYNSRWVVGGPLFKDAPTFFFIFSPNLETKGFMSSLIVGVCPGFDGETGEWITCSRKFVSSDQNLSTNIEKVPSSVSVCKFLP